MLEVSWVLISGVNLLPKNKLRIILYIYISADKQKGYNLLLALRIPLLAITDEPPNEPGTL